MRTRAQFISVATRALILSSLVAAPLSAQRDSLTEYAVKFVCGRPSTAQVQVARGQYHTAINVHNPRDTVTSLRWKIALTSDTAAPNPAGGRVSTFASLTLAADQALEIDCRHIMPRVAELARGARFAKGFVVIQPRPIRAELDVVAVYTAAGSTNAIETMALERVPVRRVPTR